MKSREAIRALEEIGFVGRNGKGDHYVMYREDRMIIIPNGKTELSMGMAGKVRSILQREKKKILSDESQEAG